MSTSSDADGRLPLLGHRSRRLSAAVAKGEVADVKLTYPTSSKWSWRWRMFGRAKPMVNMAINEKWWEGTAHSTGNAGSASAGKWPGITTGNRNTRINSDPLSVLVLATELEIPGNYAQVGGAREYGEGITAMLTNVASAVAYDGGNEQQTSLVPA